MNKMERMQRILAGQPVDRPAVCFWRHYGPLAPQETVDSHLRFYRETNMDLLKMMCDEFFTYPMDVHATPAEMLAMKPLGKDHYYVRGQVERASQINDALKGEAMTLYNAFSPYATLKHTLGDEESMQLIREHEDAALHMMEIICEDTCYMIEGILKESGTAGMMLPLQGAEEGRFTDEEYERLIAPTEHRVIECAQQHSNANLLHMCGWDCIPNRLHRWDHYPTRMISWACYVENIHPAQARTRFPGKVLLGGFDNRPGTLLTDGSREEIQAHVRHIVQTAGKDELIIGADCSIPPETNPERIRWVVEALEDM